MLTESKTPTEKMGYEAKLTILNVFVQYDIRKPIWYLDSGCSRHMTGVKSYLYKYVEQSKPKVVFGDDSTCTTEGYGSTNVIIELFAKAYEKSQLLWPTKDFAPLNRSKKATTGKAKSSYWSSSLSQEKMSTQRTNPCSSHEKGKASIEPDFKTKQTFSSRNSSLLSHEVFVPVTPIINHEKYTLVIVDEYSRNNILVNFCDKKGISQNFSPPYTPEQNGVAERKNRTLIEAARTMLSRFVFSKQYWTEAVATACYTQNRSTIVKRHLKTPYEIFDTHLFPRPLESSTLEDNKLNKPITSHLMKALMLLNSQNLELTTSTLLKLKDIHLMNIFILMNLLKGSSNLDLEANLHMASTLHTPGIHTHV
ncbi:retrovirus-related pol polyprotein from transposon TNT 1-94 [Tanacetum coccineum]